MIALKIIGIIAGVIVASFWLTIIISAGVSVGLKNYFDKVSKK
jgi:hypothetical protein